jgi:hypothetical protein
VYEIGLIDDYYYYDIITINDENHQEDIIIITLQYANMEESIHTYHRIQYNINLENIHDKFFCSYTIITFGNTTKNIYIYTIEYKF